MKKAEKLISLKEALPEVLKKLGLLDKLMEKEIIFKWKEIVGENFPSQIKPINIENKILYLKVPSPEWKAELSYLKDELINKINQKMGVEIVKDIKIFIHNK
ncbi:MAG: DUF721 domain-containing protein [candidate division WOR-3 bacterium]|nr:DUF721 domain-containing protein [candidate division WOR-3 bacterium]MCX7837518.1 DUF721 domain-containing protein [candidate division WOR-3 bacterium]MDW8113390.1 DUF721 domain-containing protein [candidate division WOR-3 bacterium]